MQSYLPVREACPLCQTFAAGPVRVREARAGVPGSLPEKRRVRIWLLTSAGGTLSMCPLGSDLSPPGSPPRSNAVAPAIPAASCAPYRELQQSLFRASPPLPALVGGSFHVARRYPRGAAPRLARGGEWGG